MDEKELKLLWESLSKNFDIGEFDYFKSKMVDEPGRKKFYDAFSSVPNGKKALESVNPKFVDYSGFDTYLGGLKKKDEVVSGQPSETPATTSQFKLPSELPSVDPTKTPEENAYNLRESVNKQAEDIYGQSRAQIQSLTKQYDDYVKELNQQLQDGVIDNFTAQGLLNHKKRRVDQELETINISYQKSIDQLDELGKEERKKILNPKNVKGGVVSELSPTEKDVNSAYLEEVYKLSRQLDELEDESDEKKKLSQSLEQKKTELSEKIGVKADVINEAVSGNIYSPYIGMPASAEDIREYSMGIQLEPFFTYANQQRFKSANTYFSNIFGYYQDNLKEASKEFSNVYMDLPDENGIRKPSQYDFELVDFMIKKGKEAVRGEDGNIYIPENAANVNVDELKKTFTRNLEGLSKQSAKKWISLTPDALDEEKLNSKIISKEAYDKKYNYENITKNLQKQLELVDRYSVNDADKKKIIEFLRYTHSDGFLADVENRYKAKEYRDRNPAYDGLTDYEKIYLEYLRIFEPESYDNRLRLLGTPVSALANEEAYREYGKRMEEAIGIDFTQGLAGGGEGYKRGYQFIKKQAEDVAISLLSSDYLNRIEYYSNLNKSGDIKDYQKSILSKLLLGYDELQKFKNTQIDRYPIETKQQIIDDIGRATGNGPMSGVGRFFYGIGSGIGSTIDFVYKYSPNLNWLYEIISSDIYNTDSRVKDLESIGDLENFNSKMVKGWEDEGVSQNAYKYAIDPEFKKIISNIDSDNKLNQKEKYEAKIAAFNSYRDSKGENPVVITKNPNAGDLNLSATAITNTISDVSQQIISQIAVAYMTGGFGNVSKLRSLVTLFGSTFSQSMDRYEAEALIEGKKNPLGVAIRKSTIDALTELIGNDIEQVRVLFKGKGTVGKIIDTITNAEWKAVTSAKGGLFNKVKNVLREAPKRIIVPGLTETGEETLGQVANNAFDGKDLFDGVKETSVTTLVGTLGTFIAGFPFAFRSINNSQKIKLFEAGANSQKYIDAVKSQLANGEISQEEANKRILVINQMKSVVEQLPKVDENGNPLSDQQLLNLSFNKYVEEQARKAKQANPKSAKIDQVIDELQDENARILSGEVEAVKPETKVEGEVAPEVKPEVVGEVAPEGKKGAGMAMVRSINELKAEVELMKQGKDSPEKRAKIAEFEKEIAEQERLGIAPDKGRVVSVDLAGEVAPEGKAEVPAAAPVQKFGLGFAPFREKNVFTEQEDVDIRNSPDYILHQETVNNLAQKLRIPIKSKLDTWGGYVDTESKNRVQEVSNAMNILATREQARLMAAVLGKAAPELQDSVIVAAYNPNGAGLEHIVKTGSFANSQEALKLLAESGLQYFTVDKKTGDILILDGDNSNSSNIDIFIDKLKENGIPAEHTLQAADVEFIGREDYDRILSEEGSKIRQQTGFDIDAFVQETAGKYAALREGPEAKAVVPEKTTSDALAGELLNILGTPEVVAGEVTPAEVYTKDNLGDISEEGLSGVQKKVINDVKNVVKAVSNLVEKTTGNELKVTIHKDQDTYGDAVIKAGGTKQDSSTKGFYLDADGTIHLNMARVTSETMLHEGFHPVLDFIAKNNPEVIDAFYSQLGNIDGGRAIINDAIEAYRGSDETTIKKEAITDFVAKVADGSFELNQSNFEKVKDFILDLIKKLGFDLTTDVKDINDVKELAKFISDKFSSGKEIMSKEFIPVKNDGEPGEVSGAGRLDASEISKAKVPGKNPLKFSKEKFKEVGLVSLPEVSLEEKAKQFNNKAIAINSDPTRVGELTLPSGKKIFMYGGLNYTALEPNVKGEIGFASTTLSKPKQVSGFINSLFPETDGVGLVLTTSQKPESMLGNAYSLEYTLDAISQLPPKVLRSAEFRREFFGKDIVAVREAFGKKEYNEFVKKYGKADLGSPEVIQAMVDELLTDIGNNFIARNSLVSNMLAGVVEKSTRAATRGEKGFVSVTPNKFIAKVLFDNFGLNQEKLFNEIGEKGIVDAYMDEGKWGFITGGFESDSKVDYKSIQDKGVVHPQFNAKFHGKNPFLLDGAYMIDKLFKPELLEKNKKGELYIDSKTGLPKPYEKKASLMVAGSMYPKGKIEVAAREFVKPIPQFSRPIELDVIEGFYSPIQKRILEFKQPKASATKWKEIVGVKSDEAVFSGLADWLNSQKPDAQLSKQDLLKFMKDNRIEIKEIQKGTIGLARKLGEIIDRKNEIENEANEAAYKSGVFNSRVYQDYLVNNDEYYELEKEEIELKKQSSESSTKYSQYQLPGGENYKEVLITLPGKNAIVRRIEDTNRWEVVMPDGTSKGSYYSESEANQAAKFETRQEAKFKSSHFDEPNIITHLRMNTRTDADGKKVLFLEEIQSDWGQKGKRQGFAGELQKKNDDIIKKSGITYEERGGVVYFYKDGKRLDYDDVPQGVREAIGQKVNEVAGMPSAPFVTNTNAWVKLGLKYALKEAVRQGADRIAWTTGEQQNERYDLSKQVDEIRAKKNQDGTYKINAAKEGSNVFTEDSVQSSRLPDIVGKELSDKIINDDGNVGKFVQYKGQDLKVGGKGMKAFYDKIIPDVAKSLVKELTGKQVEIGKSNIDVNERGKSTKDFDDLTSSLKFEKKLADEGKKGIVSTVNKDGSYTIEWYEKRPTSQQSIDITPELRQAVGEGMPQFSRDNQLLKIKDFVQAQRNKGVSDDVIREALDKVADKVGLNKQEIDNLMAGEFPTKPPKPPKEGEIEGEGEEVRKPSGIKKALVSQEVLAKVNLEKVGDKELLASGRKIIESGEVNPPSLVNKILDEGKGVLTPAEVVALITYKADLDNRQEDLVKEIAKREKAGENLGTLLADLKTLQTEIDNFDMAAIITAQQQSMSFRLRRYMLDRSYNIIVQIEKYKRANNGVIPAEIEKKFREMDAQIKELNKKLKEAEANKYDQESNAAMENIIEDVQREQANGPALYTEAELEEKIKAGVQSEIDKIYSAMPAPKRSTAQRALNALENIQKKLRSRTYDASLGIPVAVIDMGITAIKNAIKLGITVEKAVEIGIKKIKDKLNGKPWPKENDFRKDMIEGFEAEGVSLKAKKIEPKINDDGTVTIPNQLIRDLVAQGITDINDLADAVRKIVEPQLPGVTNRQIRDYITNYGKGVNPTRDDLTIKMNTAKRIGRLLSQLEDMQKMGAAAYMLKYRTQKPSGNKLTQKEQELKKLIKQLEKNAIGEDETLKKIQEQKDLDAAKATARRIIDELRDKIARKSFSKKAKKQIPADQELRDLQAEKEKVKEKFDKLQYEAEQKNKSLGRKINDALNELLVGLARTLVTGFDFGVVLTQGIIKFYRNPVMSAKAFAEGMRQFASESRQKKFENELKASGAYELIKNSGLAISVGEERASVQEQIFIANYVNIIWNTLATIVTFNHKRSKEFVKALNPFKASQRFMDAYLNYIRINTFLDISSSISKDGYPPEVDPDLHKSAAEWVNTTTMKGAKNIPRGLGFLMFSASKVASELKLFSPYVFVYYAKMPAPLRKRAILDFGKFALNFLAVNYLMRAALGDDDDDEFWDITSSNFLTFKFGDQRVSFAGGLRPMLVFWGRFFSGRYVDQYGEVSKLGERPGKDVNTKGDLVIRFFTSKFAPVPAAVWSKLEERAGREVEDDVLINKLVLPMWLQDSRELYKDNPREIGALYTMLSLIGANVRTVERPSQKEQKVGKSITFKDEYGGERKIELTEKQRKEYQKLFDEIYANKIKAMKDGSLYKKKSGEDKILYEASFVKKAKDDAEKEAKDLLVEKNMGDFMKMPIIIKTPEEEEMDYLLGRDLD